MEGQQLSLRWSSLSPHHFCFYRELLGLSPLTSTGDSRTARLGLCKVPLSAVGASKEVGQWQRTTVPFLHRWSEHSSAPVRPGPKHHCPCLVQDWCVDSSWRWPARAWGSPAVEEPFPALGLASQDPPAPAAFLVWPPHTLHLVRRIWTLSNTHLGPGLQLESADGGWSSCQTGLGSVACCLLGHPG